MELIYKEEHLCCFNSVNVDSKLIELITINPRENWESYLYNPIIIYCIQGEAEISFGHSLKKIDEKLIQLYPPGDDISIFSETGIILIIFRIKSKIYFCDRLSSKHLLKMYSNEVNDEAQNQGDVQIQKDDIGLIRIVDEMESYIKSLHVFLKAGINCIYYHELKMKELFFIFRFCYTHEELYKLSYPILNVNFEFNEFIIKNYKKVKKVRELAELYNYSVSGFDKLFKRVYGISAGKWLKNQKAKDICYEINRTNKSLKDICYEFGFSSPSHFSDYCKLHFGITPGELRDRFRIK